MVAEIRRLNAIATVAGDLVRALEPAWLTPTPKLVPTALVEQLESPATGRKKNGCPFRRRPTTRSPPAALPLVLLEP